MYSRQELADAFSALGLAPGDTVMVHASVRAVGQIAGGPDQIHLAIKDALTDRGTLMMYASCPDDYDDIGRGAYPGSRRARASSTRCRRSMPRPRGRHATTARWSSSSGRIPDSLVNDHVARFVVWGAQCAAT